MPAFLRLTLCKTGLFGVDVSSGPGRLVLGGVGACGGAGTGATGAADTGAVADDTGAADTGADDTGAVAATGAVADTGTGAEGDWKPRSTSIDSSGHTSCTVRPPASKSS